MIKIKHTPRGLRKLQQIGVCLAATSVLHSALSAFYSSSVAQRLAHRDSREVRISSRESKDAVTWEYQQLAQLPDNYSLSCEDLRNGMSGALSSWPSSIFLVVSFCNSELKWLLNACDGIEFSDVTIYSKCGKERTARQFLENRYWPLNASVVALPNVGRVDHSIAFDMVKLSSTTNHDSIVVYLKDTFPVVHQRGLRTRSLQHMISIAAGPTGFACGLQPILEYSLQDCEFGTRRKAYSPISSIMRILKLSDSVPCGARTFQNMSMWHVTSELQYFHLHAHKRSRSIYGRVDDEDFDAGQTFRDWLDAMRISLPKPATPVCYGGSFAVKVSNILYAQEPVKRMLHSLTRGDNIIEGHFAERTWAGLLSSQLPRGMRERLMCMSSGTLPFADMIGRMYGCKTSSLESHC